MDKWNGKDGKDQNGLEWEGMEWMGLNDGMDVMYGWTVILIYKYLLDKRPRIHSR